MIKNLLTVVRATPTMLAFAAPLVEKIPTPAKEKAMKKEVEDAKFSSDFEHALSAAYRRAFNETISDFSTVDRGDALRNFERVLFEEINKI